MDDLVTCEAVFVKRWCGQLADGRWRWMPLVVTKDLVKVKPPEGGIGPLKIAVAAIVFVGVVIIFFAARRELKGSAEAGAHLRQRQKVTKGLIAGQVKKLREEDLEADAETEADRAAAKIEEEAEADAGGEAPGEDAGSNSEAKSEDGSDGPSGGDDGASEEKPPGGGEAGEERSAEDQGDAGGSPDDGGDDSGEEKKD